MFDNRNIRHQLGILLTNLRYQNKKSLHQVAAEVPINVITLVTLESGAVVNWRHYYKLLRYYNCDVEISLIPRQAKITF